MFIDYVSWQGPGVLRPYSPRTMAVVLADSLLADHKEYLATFLHDRGVGHT